MDCCLPLQPHWSCCLAKLKWCPISDCPTVRVSFVRTLNSHWLLIGVEAAIHWYNWYCIWYCEVLWSVHWSFACALLLWRERWKEQRPHSVHMLRGMRCQEDWMIWFHSAFGLFTHGHLMWFMVIRIIKTTWIDHNQAWTFLQQCGIKNGIEQPLLFLYKVQ